MQTTEFPAGAMMGYFSVHHCAHFESGAYPASYQIGDGDKAAGA